MSNPSSGIKVQVVNSTPSTKYLTLSGDEKDTACFPPRGVQDLVVSQEQLKKIKDAGFTYRIL